jgi:hypothetical protein
MVNVFPTSRLCVVLVFEATGTLRHQMRQRVCVCFGRIVCEYILCKANLLGDDLGIVVRSYLRIHNLAIDPSFQDPGEMVQSFL